MEMESPRSQPARRGRNAKRSSLACVGCKRTKRKCDISQASAGSQGCTACREKGQCCEVRYDTDGRRKRPAQSDPDLETRIKLLEGLLAQQTSDRETRRSPSPDAVEAIQVVADDHVALPMTANVVLNDLPAASPTARPEKQAERAHPSPEHTQMAAAIDATSRAPYGNASHSPGAISAAHSTMSQLENSSIIFEKVVSREGGLEGQSPDNIKYYGPTSIYRLSRICNRRDRYLEGSPWADIAPDNDPSNEPEALVTYLLDLFCTWQSPHLQIFRRDLFLEDKKLYDHDTPRRRYEFFSPSLLYAIMGLASLVSTDRGARYHSTKPGCPPGRIYLDKAKKLFDMELGNPSTTTVQTALLIGSYYGAIGHQSLGWTHSGIALRMAVELGLQISCDTAVIQGQLSYEVAESRKVVFWGCYVQDKLWSAYCGRPSFIMDWDITVSQPQRPSNLEAQASDKDVVQAEVQWNIVLLTIQCSRILSELYSQKHKGNDQNLSAAASSIHESLLKWHGNLPETLTWPNETGLLVSPNVLLIHMQFYFTLLLLHRPFIDFSQGVAHDTSHLNAINGAAPNPVSICSLAATNITKLARDYSLSYDLRHIPSPAIHFVFVAATIHLINHQVAGNESHELLFQGCLSSLAEMGHSYPTGQTAVLVLQDLLRQLQPGQSTSISSQSGALDSQGLPSSITRVGGDHVQVGSRIAQQSISSPTTSGLQSSGDQHGQGDPRVGNEPGALDWPLELNFDWSTLNSPISLPRELEDIDLSMFYKSFEPLSKETNTDDTNLRPSPFYPFPENSSNSIGGSGELFETQGAHESSTLFLSRYYGTAFGLG